MAALSRLGLAPSPMEVLSVDVMVPQVAQGALAVECRADDAATRDLLKTARRPQLPALCRGRAVVPGHHRGRLRPPVAGHAISGGRAAAPRRPPGRPDGSALVRRGATGPAADGARLGADVAEMVLDSGGAIF